MNSPETNQKYFLILLFINKVLVCPQSAGVILTILDNNHCIEEEGGKRPQRLLKGSDWLCKVVELSMQCCGKLLSDSFETHYTF